MKTFVVRTFPSCPVFIAVVMKLKFLIVFPTHLTATIHKFSVFCSCCGVAVVVVVVDGGVAIVVAFADAAFVVVAVAVTAIGGAGVAVVGGMAWYCCFCDVIVGAVAAWLLLYLRWLLLLLLLFLQLFLS